MWFSREQRGNMKANNLKRDIGKTIGFVLVAVGIIYLGFFIFSRDYTPPPGAVACVVVGVILMMISKR